MNHDTGSYFLSTSFDKFLLREPARFHGNDTSRRRVDSFSVLRKASDNAENVNFNLKRFEIVFSIFIMSIVQPNSLFKMVSLITCSV